MVQNTKYFMKSRRKIRSKFLPPNEGRKRAKWKMATFWDRCGPTPMRTATELTILYKKTHRPFSRDDTETTVRIKKQYKQNDQLHTQWNE
jgi:hypothetical protein